MITVIVATRERPTSVMRLLGDVLHQAPSKAEVVVVDQSDAPARERTAAWVAAQDDDRLRHQIHQPPGLPAARNAGLASTVGEIVVFFDDDVTLFPGCLAAHLAAYRDPTVGGVVGRIVEERLVSNAWRTTNRIGRSGRIHTRLDGPDACFVETLKGANMSFR
ncbi:MAG: glycosyltransferase family 2 protein, partial [Myxococcota bacterium]